MFDVPQDICDFVLPVAEDDIVEGWEDVSGATDEIIEAAPRLTSRRRREPTRGPTFGVGLRDALCIGRHDTSHRAVGASPTGERTHRRLLY
ncbi:MAG TPA: hypothetical protein VN959_08540 [Mycobacterium sp.]|nr:hypothetical protein [Mycobacterium sp.]